MSDDEYLQGIVAVLGKNRTPVGTGFLVHSRSADRCLIVTCFHVLELAVESDSQHVAVRLRNGNQRNASIKSEWCRSRDNGDIAVLEILEGWPEGVQGLVLGSTTGTSHSVFDTFGYPEANREPGMHGPGHVIGKIEYRACHTLQLRSEVVTCGFSGAPVWHRQRKRVIGVIRDITIPDEFGRLGCTALATAAEVLLDICPLLKVSEECPYLGLSAFEEHNARFFKGRARIIERLMARITESSRLLVVIGPSGSGKSSAVHAGILPLLRGGRIPGSNRWGILKLRLGSTPFADFSKLEIPIDSLGLVTATSDWLARQTEFTQIVLVIDQLEDLFISASPLEIRKVFEELADLVTQPSRTATAILILRADFYGRLLDASPQHFVELLDMAVTHLPSDLEEDEVRAMINEPAAEAGFKVDCGLTELIVSDMRRLMKPVESTPSFHYGATTVLPLLENCLRQLWYKQIDGELTPTAYRQVGGLAGNIGEWAENAFQRLSPSDRALAWNILTNLVHPGDPEKDIPTSRQRLLLKDLCGRVGRREEVERIIKHFAEPDVRLLVTAVSASRETTVELIHDAVFDRWPRFRTWLQRTSSNGFLAWRGRIEPLIVSWAQTCADNPKKRKNPRVGRRDLMEAVGWLERAADDLLPMEKLFIKAALARRRAQRFYTAFALVAVCSFLVIGGYTWQQRDAIASQQIESAKQAMQSGEFGKAAEMLSSVSLPFDILRRSHEVRALQEGLEVVDEMQLKRIQRSYISNRDPITLSAANPYSFDPQETLEGYKELFQRSLQIDLNGEAKEVSASIKRLPIYVALLQALDECAAVLQLGSIWHNASLEHKVNYTRQRDHYLDLGLLIDLNNSSRAEICQAVKGNNLDGIRRIVLRGGRSISPSQYELLANCLSPAEGLKVMEIAQAIYPDDFWTNSGLAMRLDREGRSLEASGFYRVAITIRPDVGGIHTNLAVALSNAGMLEQAKSSVHTAIRVGDETGRAHSTLSMLLVNERDFPAAVIAAGRAIRENPRLVDPHVNLSAALSMQGKLTEAIEAITNAIQLSKELNLDHRAYQARLASLLIDRATSQEAASREADLDRALNAIENSVGGPVIDVRMDTRFLRGQVYFARQQFLAALGEFKAAAKSFPSNCLAHFNVGVTLDRIQQSVADRTSRNRILWEAVHSFEEVLKCNPAHSEARYLLGYYFLKLERYPEAERALVLVELPPEHLFYFDHTNDWGTLRLKQEKLSDAEAMFRIAIQLKPDNPWVLKSLADSLLYQGRFDEAEEAYRLAQAQDYVNKLELIRSLLSDYEEGIVPDSYQSQLVLGGALHYRGRFAESLRIYEVALTQLDQVEGMFEASDLYLAACSAVLTATGGSNDEAASDLTSHQLLAVGACYLKQRLAYLEKVASTESDPHLALQELRKWQTTPKLARVRDEESLIGLSEETQATWRVFWARVNRLVKIRNELLNG